MTDQREKRIQEITRKHSMHVYDGYEDDVQNVVGFLLSEVSRLQVERDAANELLEEQQQLTHNFMKMSNQYRVERDKAVEGLKYAHRFAKHDVLYDEEYGSNIIYELGEQS